MTKLELLNVFLNRRLTAAAEEIFGAVKDTVVEYQSEILRSREENERLRRLLNAAVRQLLQSEQYSVHSQEDDSNWRSRAELLSQVKEESSRSVQPDGSTEARDSGQANCSHAQQHRSRPLSVPSVSPASLSSVEVKIENAEEENEKSYHTNSLSLPITVSPDYRAAQNISCSNTPKNHRPLKPDQQGKEARCSSYKQNTHIHPVKKARSLRQPLSRFSHSHQSTQRWHSCKECGKGFSFACQLEVHMRWHTKEKPYSCIVCRKSFTTVSMLKRHHRIHTGEKPFCCKICGKCFNQSAHLNTHFRLHTRERASWS